MLAVCGVAALDTARNPAPLLPISHRREAKKVDGGLGHTTTGGDLFQRRIHDRKEPTTMRDLNKVQLIGHLGHDPDVRYLDNGTACIVF